MSGGFLRGRCFGLLASWTLSCWIGSLAIAWAAAPDDAVSPFQFEMTVADPTIGADDDLVIEGKLKNVSGKDLLFYDSAQPRTRFVHLATKEVWVRAAELYPPPPGAPPALQKWKAGEVRPLTMKLGPRTRYAKADAKPESARVGLPAGKYQLTVSVAYLYRESAEMREAKDVTLTSPAVAIEIVEK